MRLLRATTQVMQRLRRCRAVHHRSYRGTNGAAAVGRGADAVAATARAAAALLAVIAVEVKVVHGTRAVDLLSREQPPGAAQRRRVRRRARRRRHRVVLVRQRGDGRLVQRLRRRVVGLGGRVRARVRDAVVAAPARKALEDGVDVALVRAARVHAQLAFLRASAGQAARVGWVVILRGALPPRTPQARTHYARERARAAERRSPERCPGCPRATRSCP